MIILTTMFIIDTGNTFWRRDTNPKVALAMEASRHDFPNLYFTKNRGVGLGRTA